MNVRSRRVNRLLAFGIAVAMATAGCAGQQAADKTTSVTTSSISTSAQQPSGVVIDITIAGGVVTPTNAEVVATVGQSITLRVSSDVVDELHVHSIPEHSFAVAAQQNQTFEFTVAVPGRVDVELHKLDRTIAVIQVRP